MINVYDDLIEDATETFLPHYDWRLLKAQYYAESLLNPAAVSPVGAMGIAQIMPRTWDDLKEKLLYSYSASAFDPDLAIPAGAYYMSQLMKSWSSPRPEVDRICLALASYNAGFGNLLKAQKEAGGVNDYASIIRALPKITGRHSEETSTYVKRILKVYLEIVTG